MEKRDTKKDFITAFWKLYQHQAINKISISQLCKLAGYNRATFYNHFDNIDDLFNQAIDNIFIPAKNEILAKYDFNTLLYDNFLESLFSSFFIQNNDYIELLFKHQDHHLLGNKIKKIFLSIFLNELNNNMNNKEMAELLIEYQISAVLGVINYWYQNKHTISSPEIIEKLYYITTNGVLNCLKNEIDLNKNS